MVVAVAVAAIVGLKAYVSGGRPATEPIPGPSSAEAADCDPDEPFPASPAQQVQWVLCHRRPAMILFYSNYCRPCRMMDSLVQMVKPDYAAEVVFIDAVYDDPANAALLRWAKVGSIPASYFLTASGEGNRIVGLMKQQDLRAELARIAATD